MTRVGVTGHRRLVSADACERAIDRVLKRIASAFPGPLTLVSPLAEGADQLVVQRAFALGHRRLIVPLPLPKEDYLRDFRSAAGQAEFQRLLALADEVVVVDQAVDAVRAYHDVGRWVLDHADVLIAVWDGRPARGEAGTGRIVEEARRRELPMAWVHAEQVHKRWGGFAAAQVSDLIVTHERF